MELPFSNDHSNDVFRNPLIMKEVLSTLSFTDLKKCRLLNATTNHIAAQLLFGRHTEVRIGELEYNRMEQFLSSLTKPHCWKLPFSFFHLNLSSLSLDKIQAFLAAFGGDIMGLGLRYPSSSEQGGNEIKILKRKISVLFEETPNLEKLELEETLEKLILQETLSQLPRIKHLATDWIGSLGTHNWNIHHNFPSLKVFEVDQPPSALFVEYLLTNLVGLEEIKLGCEFSADFRDEENKLWNLYTGGRARIPPAQILELFDGNGGIRIPGRLELGPVSLASLKRLKKMEIVISHDIELDALVLLSQRGGLPPLDSLIIHYDTAQRREEQFLNAEFEWDEHSEENYLDQSREHAEYLNKCERILTNYHKTYEFKEFDYPW